MDYLPNMSGIILETPKTIIKELLEITSIIYAAMKTTRKITIIEILLHALTLRTTFTF